MRSTVALLAAAAMAIFAPGVAAAQDEAPPIDAKKREKGQAEAPALLARTNRQCTVTDAVHRGGGRQKDEQGNNYYANLYEVACSDGPGLIIIAREDAEPLANDCVQYATAAATPAAEGEEKSKGLTCILPGNLEPYKGLQPVIAKSGVSCQIAKARWTGYSPSALVNQYEVGCADGNAYVITAPVNGSTTALAVNSCIKASGAGVTCEYMPKETVLAAISRLAAPAARQCQVTQARFVGSTSSGASFYEVGCADEKAGYMFEVDAQDKFVRAIDCAKAGGLAGGCTYTNAAVAETEQAGIYTKLAGQIGYQCDVAEYRPLGIDAQKREVVELKCKSGSGAVAFLPTGAGQKGEYYNCIRAGSRNLRCALNAEADSYKVLTSQVSGKGKSCTVSGARGMGTDPSGSDYVEVACSGQPGMVIKYAAGSDNVQEVMACSAAKGLGGGCKLPQ